MRIETLRPDITADHEKLAWLPQSRVLRAALALVALALGALVFAAWISPNMVFDLANMVFCG
jgi:hypothetical protein